MITLLFSMLLLYFAFLAMPGPDFAIVLRYSVRYGMRAGFLCALGISIGMMLNGVIAFSIGTTLKKHFLAVYLLFISLGVAYLIYIGFRLVYNAIRHRTVWHNLDASNTGRAFLTALLANLTNVKVILFFGAIFLVINQLTNELKVVFLISSGGLTFVWFSLITWLFNGKIKSAFFDKIRYIEFLVGVMIILFAVGTFCEFVYPALL
jgi:threonine/homoserine/homoserine lactone efflux protein